MSVSSRNKRFGYALLLGIPVMCLAAITVKLRRGGGGDFVTLRQNVAPLTANEESQLESFMMVGADVIPLQADFVAAIDLPAHTLYARLTITKEDLARMLSSGWSFVPTKSRPRDDSSLAQAALGRAVNWNYLPRGPQDRHIVKASAAGPDEDATALVRPTQDGYVVFIDRRVGSAVPQGIVNIMGAGVCDEFYISQEEIDFRTSGPRRIRAEAAESKPASKPATLTAARPVTEP